jgi:hypothetical protein
LGLGVAGWELGAECKSGSWIGGSEVVWRVGVEGLEAGSWSSVEGCWGAGPVLEVGQNEVWELRMQGLCVVLVTNDNDKSKTTTTTTTNNSNSNNNNSGLDSSRR